MVQIILPLAFFGLLFSCASNSQRQEAAISGGERVERYQKFAGQIVKKVADGASQDEVATMGMDLMNMAKPIISDFQAIYPDCSPLLERILAKSEEMTELNLESIERGYHEGEWLPQAPDHCHAAKELIVHPATVVVIARRGHLQEDGRQKIADEIEEVVEHANFLY